MTDLLKTALYDWHAAHHGTLVDFAGWSMPVQYGSIVDEHHATRQAAGLFDVSHMARFRFDGADAERLLDSLVTRKVKGMKDGQIRYGLVTNERGTILDDVLVYRLRDPEDDPFHMLVVNASNRHKIWQWINAHFADHTVHLSDHTESTAMIAVQGPKAIALVDRHLNDDLAGLRYYRGFTCEFDGAPVICSRTGYTGEDGCELIVRNEAAVSVWETLIAEGAAEGVRAAGLGARDTLRLEAGMPLYGHELNEELTPYDADLGFAVSRNDHDFVGREAVFAAEEDASRRIRVGFKVDGKRPAREGGTVYLAGGDRELGMITSGTTSPTLGYPIAMGYVARDHAATGTHVEIDVRGKRVAAVIVDLPFYKRS